MTGVRSWRTGRVFIVAIFIIFMASKIYEHMGTTTSSSPHPLPKYVWTDTAVDAWSTGLKKITTLGKYTSVPKMLSHYYTNY